MIDSTLNLFEQSVSLLAQACNSITYYRRLNILSALLQDSKKVKDILLEKTNNLNLDEKSLIRNKFKEYIIKTVKIKIKSKEMFKKLQNPGNSSSQSSSSSAHYFNNSLKWNTFTPQPFQKASLPNRERGRGCENFSFRSRGQKGKGFNSSERTNNKVTTFSSKLQPDSSISKGPFSNSIEFSDLSSRGKTETFFRKLGNVNKRCNSPSVCAGISDTLYKQNTFSISTIQGIDHEPKTHINEERESKEHDRKGSSKINATMSRSIFEQRLYCKQKWWRVSSGHQSESIKRLRTPFSFQNGRIMCFEKTSLSSRFNGQIRL